MKLILFPFHDWRKSEAEGFRTRDAHLIEAIIADPSVETVLIVDRPSSPLETLIGRKSRTTGVVVSSSKARSSRAVITNVAPRTFVVDVATADLTGPVLRRRGWWFDVFERADTLELIDWAIDRTGTVDASLIAWVPTVAPAILRRLGDGAGGLVYDSLDNWLIHPALRRHALDAEMAYAKVLPRAVRVFASAPASARALRRFVPAVSVLPNGVDPQRFAGSARRPTDISPGLTVGYAGKIASRIDAELVTETARLLPDVSFLFVGPVLERRTGRVLARSPNVRLLGDRHYSLLPGYLEHFDVAWIPHRVGQGETGGDPIKLYEYWAAGKPIVSTDIDGVARWQPRVSIVRSAAEAAAAIRPLLTQSGGVGRDVPAERTWRAIAAALLLPLQAAQGRPGSERG